MFYKKKIKILIKKIYFFFVFKLEKLCIKLVNIFFFKKNKDSVSIITTSGNRKKITEIFLKKTLNQDYKNFKVFISIYADKENTYENIKSTFEKEIKSEKLFVINTQAEIFNKSLAVNKIINKINSKYIFFLDCDVPLDNKTSLSEIIEFKNYKKNFEIFSINQMGQILLNKDDYFKVGGMSTNLGDIHAPDDFDLITRISAGLKRNYYSKGIGSRIIVKHFKNKFDVTYKEVPYEKKYYLDLNYYKLFPNPKRDKKRDFKDFVYYDFFNLKWKNRKEAYTTVISYLLKNKKYTFANQLVDKLNKKV